MPDPDSGFLLKVLSGVQYGVEVALEDGTYSFGSGADADVQIVDVTLAPIHGHLRIRGGKLALRSDGGEIATSSGLALPPGKADWAEIAQLDVVMVGTTRFAVGGRGAKWGALAREGATGGTPARPVAQAGQRRRSRGMAFAAAGVLAAIGLTATGVYLGGGAAPMLIATPAPEVQPVEIVRAALAGLPFRHAVRATAAVDGTLDAEGYVQSVVERRAVLNALNDTRLQVRRRIWVRDIIENEVAELIRSQGLPVAHSLSEDGILTLSGDVLDPVQAERIVGLIRGEVFGLAGLNDQIRTAEHYLTEVRGVIEAARLRDRVILRLDGLLIEATGVVTNDQIDNWVGFIQVYSRRFAPILPLRSFVTLEAAGGEVGAPIVIGVAEPGQGRVVPAEALSSDAVPQAQDIFALPEGALTPAAPDPAAGDQSAAPGLTDAGAPAGAGGGAEAPVVAGQSGPGAAPAPVGPAPIPEVQRSAVIAAAQALIDSRPDLAERMLQLQAEGATPDMALIQEVLGVVGGRMVVRAAAGGIEPMFVLPGAEAPLSFAEIVAALTEVPARDPAAPADAASPDAAARPGALPLPEAGAAVPAASTDRAELLRALLDGRAVPAPVPASIETDADGLSVPSDMTVALGEFRFGRPDPVDAQAPPPEAAAPIATAPEGAASAGPGVATSAPGAADAPGPASETPGAGGEPTPTPALAGLPAAALPSAASPDQDPRADTAARPVPAVAAAAPVDRLIQQVDQPLPDPEGSGVVGRFGAYPAYRMDSPLNAVLDRMVSATQRLIGLNAATEGGVVVLPASTDGGDTVLDIAALQNEAIASGATLLPQPVPLGAARVQDLRFDACWPDSRVQVTALPTIILWLDILSLNVDLDIAMVDPLVQGVLMEAALSPERVAECLVQIDNPIALRLLSESTFLSESARNSDFGQFLFRSVPVFDLALTGVNLQGDRYVQAIDGRRLRAGMAPTLNSRLSVIGDLGALFRVEGGYQVLLYPQTLSWRIARN